MLDTIHKTRINPEEYSYQHNTDILHSVQFDSYKLAAY